LEDAVQHREIWRTPDAHCDRGPSSEKRMKMKLEKKMPISLNDQVAHPNLMWPTPRANNIVNKKERLTPEGRKAEVRTESPGRRHNVADAKGNQYHRELRDGEQKNGEKKKRGKSDRRGSQPGN